MAHMYLYHFLQPSQSSSQCSTQMNIQHTTLIQEHKVLPSLVVNATHHHPIQHQLSILQPTIMNYLTSLSYFLITLSNPSYKVGLPVPTYFTSAHHQKKAHTQANIQYSSIVLTKSLLPSKILGPSLELLVHSLHLPALPSCPTAGVYPPGFKFNSSAPLVNPKPSGDHCSQPLPAPCSTSSLVTPSPDSQLGHTKSEILDDELQLLCACRNLP